MENNKDKFTCKECNWQFPRELIDNFLKGSEIFCEECGMINIKEANQVERQDIPTKLKNMVSKVKTKTTTLKKKIKDFIDKYD